MKTLFTRLFVDQDLGNTSYLIASEETGLAAVVDPQRDIDRYLRVADGLGLRLVYALDTHLHADFVSGVRELAKQFQGTAFCIGASAGARLQFEHQPLVEGDRLSLGDLSIGVMATPGHTPEHISYAIYQEGTHTPGALFSGGALIVGGAARTDLSGPEQAAPLAHELFHTLHDKLLRLPDEVEVYPTHGAGSYCVAGGSGERVTTIGQERRHNALAQIGTEDEFVLRALEGLPSYPTYYRYMRATNQKGARILGGLPPLPALSPEAVYRQIDAGVVVIDIREPEQFLSGHVPGSYGIPLATPLLSWTGWVIPFGSPIILVADDSEQREQAVRQLIRIGYDNLRGYLAGGLAAWAGSEFPVACSRSVTAHELQDWLAQKDAPFVLDVRMDNEWELRHVQGACHVEAGDLPSMSRNIVPDDRPVVVHCARGNRSTVALSVLERRGFSNLHVLESGIDSWINAGCEVARGKAAGMS